MNGSEVGRGKHGRCGEVAVSGGSTVILFSFNMRMFNLQLNSFCN